MSKLLLVGIGGFLGSIGRYLVAGWVYRLLPAASLPWGTLTVNVLGCLGVGVAVAVLETRSLPGPELQLLLLVGFFGGFTTYSTFGFESFELLRQAQVGAFLWNVGLHLVLGLAAVAAGHALTRSLLA